ncbi:MAG: acetate--CoA ligase family protein, partial [Acidobacteriota bacterium]
HKTDLGGVRVGLTAGEIGPAIDGLRERFPHASMLIEEQVEGASAELIVGGIVDPSFGPAVMVGSGGILTELVEDVSFRLAPCTAAEAHRMIAELLIAPLFRGYRGLRLDAGGLATTIETVSLLILDLGQRLERLDINPIVFAGGRWIALDAKIGLHLAGASAIEREEENH